MENHNLDLLWERREGTVRGSGVGTGQVRKSGEVSGKGMFRVRHENKLGLTGRNREGSASQAEGQPL